MRAMLVALDCPACGYGIELDTEQDDPALFDCFICGRWFGIEPTKMRIFTDDDGRVIQQCDFLVLPREAPPPE